MALTLLLFWTCSQRTVGVRLSQLYSDTQWHGGTSTEAKGWEISTDQHSLLLHNLPKKGSIMVVGICRYCSCLSQLVLIWPSPTPLILPLTLANTKGQPQAALATVTYPTAQQLIRCYFHWDSYIFQLPTNFLSILCFILIFYFP